MTSKGGYQPPLSAGRKDFFDPLKAPRDSHPGELSFPSYITNPNAT